MNQRKKLNFTAETLSQATLILIVGIAFIFFTVTCIIILFCNIENIDFSNIGQVGDAIGGITSPIVNLLGAILVFLALKAQIQANRLVQDQVDDQYEQHHVNRITDIIYLQIQRIDENLRSHTFYLNGKKNTGRAGLYSINHTLESVPTWVETGELAITPEEIMKIINIIDENSAQLIDYYDHLYFSFEIIRINIEKANLLKPEADELYRLFLLNLGINVEKNIDKIILFLNDALEDENKINDNSGNVIPDEQFDSTQINKLHDTLTKIVRLIHEKNVTLT